MDPDRSVLRVLEAALAADESNTAIRLHLAGLLVDWGEPGPALVHVQLVLAARPDDLEALDLAALAAAATGDATRALAWRRLHDALTFDGTGDTSTPEARHPAGGGGVGAAPGEWHPPAEGTSSSDETADGVRDLDAELLELLDEERSGRVTLADVAGLDEVQHRLEASFLGPMRSPELRKMYGASMRGGLLLWGPPGCGKTFLARAVAGELGAQFFSVGLHDVLDMWLGNSEKKLHDLFDLARRRQPSVLFFDEVDAIGHARSDLARSAGRNVVAQLLTELDGVDQGNDGVFVIAATNQPWDVDPALRRPGRLDRSMLVLPPDAAARGAILAYHLRNRPTSDEALTGVVVETDGFSGADLRLVCDDAAQIAMADAVRTGVARTITATDLSGAAKGLRPSTAPWLDMARNFCTYANPTGEYDELVTYLRSRHKGRT